MDEIKLLPYIIPIYISLLLLLLWSISKSSPTKNPPPSPPKLPILGNLHQLGSLPHQTLQTLSEIHGPLMLLHFGSIPVLVVSTADSAHAALRTHDLTFSNRPLIFRAVKKFIRNGKNIGFAPYGEYWRQMRSVFVLHLLSSKRVQSFRFIREEETALFVQKIQASSDNVNLSKMFSEFTGDVICRSAFGRKYGGLENGQRFLRVLKESLEVLGTICVGDFIPWLSWISRVNGFDGRVEKAAKEMDEFLEGVIEDCVESSKKKGRNAESFADIMVDLQKDEGADIKIDRESIKASLVDILGAGTDTISTILIWAMAELLRHPTMMQKLQTEVRQVVGDRQDINDNDLEKMHYLKAVIKEAYRLHPPVPLSIPRVASHDVKIKEYDVPAGSILMTNAWAIGRDARTWEEPQKFKPERFLNSLIDYKGLHFELIPFGAGRRGCPGIAFSTATIEFVLANLAGKFNWKLPDGMEDVDMSESPAATLHKASPLLAVATRFM